jgi:hypothetical protein
MRQMIYTSLLYMDDGDNGLGLNLSSAATIIKIDTGNDGARRERGEQMQTYISTLMDAARSWGWGSRKVWGVRDLEKMVGCPGRHCVEKKSVAGPPSPLVSQRSN